MTSENDLIKAAAWPVTARSLTSDFGRIGVATGDIVIVHSSMSALGWVAGGPQAVVEALLAAVGPAGTVVMPTQSSHLSDPAGWSNPPVPPAWVETVRAELPAYDPYLTPTSMMGQVVECFRQHRATVRSAHPTLSLAANGADAATIVHPHPLAPGLGDTSPVGRLYEADAKVLLVGVTHANNTSMHLAEYRATWPSKRQTGHGAPLLVDGRREWVEYDDLLLDEADFAQIGDAFAEATGRESTDRVGAAVGRLCRQRAIVDFAAEWISTNRA